MSQSAEKIRATLENLAQKFEERSFTRQAVLLRSKSAVLYLMCLGDITRMEDVERQIARMEDVERQIGRNLYSSVADAINMLGRRLDLLLAPGELKDTFTNPISFYPLEVHLTERFNPSHIQEAMDKAYLLRIMRLEANQTIYDAVKEIAGNDDDLLFRIYKDEIDPMHNRSTDDALSEAKDQYLSYFRSMRDMLNELINKDAPDILIINGIKLIKDKLIPNCTDNTEGQSPRETAEKLVRVLNECAAKPDILHQQFEKWLNFKQAQLYPDTIKMAKLRLSEVEYAMFPIGMDLGDDKLLFVGGDGNDQFECDRNEMQKIAHASMPVRRSLMDQMEMALEDYQRFATGLYQIVSGCPAINPDADPVSNLQNDARFPSINYPPETVAEAKRFADGMRELIDTIPDISDLCLPTKMRNVKKVQYTLQMEDKNPLDVTFGNDSGCCINVPEKNEKLGNGVYVPMFIFYPQVKIFGLYVKKEDGQSKRMGLVLAFKTFLKGNTDAPILACNSLELSRFGVVGGRNTIGRITSYVEDCLIQYGREAGYVGVAMGRHVYNTSVNYSKRSSQIVKDTLELEGKIPTSFYSDIFERDSTNKTLKTRKNSCYWIQSP